MAAKRALLIVPPTGRYIREDRCQTPIKDLKTVSLRPPIDLLYAAGAFEQSGCECKVVDYPGENWEWARLEQDLREFRPDHLVLSITTPSLEQDLKAATLAKKVSPTIQTIAKGAHFNALDVPTLKTHLDLDIVLRGEYELACMEIGGGMELTDIQGLTWRTPQGEIRRNADRPFLDKLDALPFPARHLANNALYFRPDTNEMQTTVITNRGCPFTCIYCLAQQVAGAKNRYRSVENVIAELKECMNRHNIRNFLFRSDLFTQNKKWVKSLCEAILDEKLDIEWACNSRVDTINEDLARIMKKAHCWIIAFGVESGNQEILDKIDKEATIEQARKGIAATKAAGIKSSVYFLMGLPWDTPKTIEDNMKFARELEPDFLEIFYVYPFPGTPLYDIAVKEGLLKPGEIPADAYSAPVMPGHFMSLDEFQKWRRRAMRDYYLRPKYIARTLRGIRSAREFGNYMKVGFRQLKDLVLNN